MSSAALEVGHTARLLSHEELVRLFDASCAIASDMNAKHTVSQIIQYAKSLLRCAQCILYVYDASSDCLVAVHRRLAPSPRVARPSTVVSQDVPLGLFPSPRLPAVTIPPRLTTPDPARTSSGSSSSHRIKIRAEEGTPGRVFRSGLTIRLEHDGKTDDENCAAPTHRFGLRRSDASVLNPDADAAAVAACNDPSVVVFSSLSVPVFDVNRKVVGVLQAVNKLRDPVVMCRDDDDQEEDLGGCVVDGWMATTEVPDDRRVDAPPKRRRSSAAAPPMMGCEPFTDHDELMLKHMALLAGVSLYNAALYREAVVSRDRADGLLKLLQSLRKDLSIQSAMLALSTYAKQLVRAQQCVVYVIERRNRDTPQLVSISSASGKEARMSLGTPDGIMHECVTSGMPVVIPDAREDPRVADMVDASTPLDPYSSTMGYSISPRAAVLPAPPFVPTPLRLPPLGQEGTVSTNAMSCGVIGNYGPAAKEQQMTLSADGLRHEGTLVKRTKSNSSTAALSRPINNLAIVPIKAENQLVLGLIQLADKLDDDGDILPFTEEDLRLLEMFGTLVGPRLERSEFGLRATPGRHLSEAARASSSPPGTDRRKAPLPRPPTEPVIREEQEESDDEEISESSAATDPRTAHGGWTAPSRPSHVSY